MSKMLLDEIDKTLISELQRNGRATLSHIGKKTGISHVAIRKRLARLLEKEVIKVSAHLNAKDLDAKIAAMLVEVENSQRLKELTELFKNCPRTVLLSGIDASNLLTVVVGEDFSTLESVVGVCSLRVQKGIRRSDVHIGGLPTYPQFLPIRITSQKKTDTAPCRARCDQCESFKSKHCLGCPATRFYRGPL